ncbi:MAG: NAD(P)-dependent oxidoreductase [Hyphomonadaceae bacterium]|nr:NAD(P)-dependent oxidoreductase [Hyphomonadaceae bacterium]
MKVLITGGTGFLGGHAVRALSDAGLETVATYARRPGPELPGVRWLPLDLLDPGAVRTLVEAERPTHLLHMAWRAVHGNVSGARDNFDWLKASLDLAGAFADAGGKRIVGLGSCFEYDWSNGHCIEDETPLVPSTLYGAAKNALRAALFGLAQDAGVEFAWARVFFTYGPGENESRFVASLATSMLRGEPAEMTSGVQVRDFLYAGDIADALVTLVKARHTGAFNVGTGRPVTLLDIANEVARQTGRPDLLRAGVRQAKPFEPPLIRADMTRTANVLGWEARTSLQDGVAKTIAAMRNE